MTSESTDDQRPDTQDTEADKQEGQRPHPRRGIIVTASIFGLIALAFYVGEIIVVAFDLAGH